MQGWGQPHTTQISELPPCCAPPRPLLPPIGLPHWPRCSRTTSCLLASCAAHCARLLMRSTLLNSSVPTSALSTSSSSEPSRLREARWRWCHRARSRQCGNGRSERRWVATGAQHVTGPPRSRCVPPRAQCHRSHLHDLHKPSPAHPTSPLQQARPWHGSILPLAERRNPRSFSWRCCIYAPTVINQRRKREICA